MIDGNCDHTAAFGCSVGSDRLLLACGEGGSSSLLCFCEIRIALLPSAAARRGLQLNQGANAEPFRRGTVYVLTRNGILETRLRSISQLHARFPDAFIDVNHGIAIAPSAITGLMIVSKTKTETKTKWIMSHLQVTEQGTYRRPVYAKVSRRAYRNLRRRLSLPKLCSAREK